MKIVILGDGLLGNEIHQQTNWNILSRKKDDIDALIFDWEYKLYDYDIILNCIANTDTYSNDKLSHWNINYKFVTELVDFCNRYNKKLIHISTDYVYTNSIETASENDVPIHGNNWYSYTKLLADGYIELKSKNYLICRGTHKPNPFPYENAWSDQIGNFDYVNVIAEIIIKLVSKNVTGIYNIGTEPKTIFELAKKTKDVKPTLKNDLTPDNTTMNLEKMKSIL